MSEIVSFARLNRNELSIQQQRWRLDVDYMTDHHVVNTHSGDRGHTSAQCVLY
ncbi:MAG: hypothetical protein AAFX99_33960 [Myxococcota bacterium]